MAGIQLGTTGGGTDQLERRGKCPPLAQIPGPGMAQNDPKRPHC